MPRRDGRAREFELDVLLSQALEPARRDVNRLSRLFFLRQARVGRKVTSLTRGTGTIIAVRGEIADVKWPNGEVTQVNIKDLGERV